METTSNKREVPSILRKVLAVDAYLTDVFTKKFEKILTFRQLQLHCKTLEITCHGILWLGFWLAFIWILDNKNLYQMQINFFLGLILDIIIIAVIKSIVRRRRPNVSKDFLEIGPDKFSFPSGHASRSAFIVYFFINIWPFHLICIPPLLAWSTSVCISRVLARKHYLLDIAVGVICGISLGMFIGYIYLSKETCSSLIYWITDEKLEGGEYHV